jgi:hypothetical protein
VLLSPGFAGIAAFFLLRQLTGAGAVASAGAALVFALCPYVLGCMANGQVAKLQHWVLPAYLLALHLSLKAARPRRALASVFLVAFVTSFTAPSYGLQLPFLWLACAGAGVVTATGGRRRLAARAAVALLVTGVAMLPALHYFRPQADMVTVVLDDREVEVLPASLPAGRGMDGPRTVVPENNIQLDDMVLGVLGRDLREDRTNHVGYLGLPLILLSLASLRWRFPGQGLGWALLLGGGVLSLGPELHWGGSLLRVAGKEVLLPAKLLEWARYPLDTSGMYYRLVLMASLGLSILLGGLASRFRPGRAVALTWTLGLVSVADGFRSTGGLWPVPLRGDLDRAMLEQMAEDPVVGAVLDLPMRLGPHTGKSYFLAALVHRRPVSGLLRSTLEEGHVVARQRALEGALHAGDAALVGQLLAGEGFAFLVHHPEIPPQRPLHGGEVFPRIEGETLVEVLGPPLLEGRTLVWRVEDLLRPQTP